MLPLMDDYTFVIGLMRDNYESVGFIPQTTIKTRYFPKHQYIIQRDNHGKPIGYILYGKPTPGGTLTVAQHVIDYDFRLKGYGHDALKDLIDIATQSNCKDISLRCAENLQSNSFWQAEHFSLSNTTHPNNRRNRAINHYYKPIWTPLFPI